MPKILPLLLLAGCATGPGVRGSRAQLSRESPAFRLEREFTGLAVRYRTESLWPGFDPLSVPLAVYDGHRTLLFRFPSNADGFAPATVDGLTALVRDGRHESVVANSNARIGNVPSATILLDGNRARPAGDMVPIVFHESFHVFQREHHPSWTANEIDLFTYPTDSATLLGIRRLETEALRRALAAREAQDAGCWARKALALRATRYARMDSAFAAYERGTELNEGLATYVELRSAGRNPVIPAGEFGPHEVRLRAYASGSALAFLLDRFSPTWRQTLERGDRGSLDGLLATALGAGPSCSFDPSFERTSGEKATSDVATAVAESQRRASAFEGRPGWRLVVEVAGGEPLWPQGFDPLNVEVIGGARVIHRRFVRLGNGAGQLEVLQMESITEGIGPHPLFQGVRRVVLTGLAEPAATDSGGVVTVRAANVTLEFKGAQLQREANRITVTLGAR